MVLRNEVTKWMKDDISAPPTEGIYVYGLYLEGAGWDKRNMKLIESKPKVLFELMPVIRIYAENNSKLSCALRDGWYYQVGWCYKHRVSLFLLPCDKDYTMLSSGFTFTPVFNEYWRTAGLFLERSWEAMVLDSSCLSNKADKIALANEIRNRCLE